MRRGERTHDVADVIRVRQEGVERECVRGGGGQGGGRLGGTEEREGRECVGGGGGGGQESVNGTSAGPAGAFPMHAPSVFSMHAWLLAAAASST